MDEFVRPPRRPQPLQQPPNPIPPPQSSGVEAAVDPGEGPEVRPTLFTKDAADAAEPTPPSIEELEQTTAEKEAAAKKAIKQALSNQRFTRKHIVAIALTAMVAVFAGIGWFVFSHLRSNAPSTQTKQQDERPMSATATLIEGTVEYKRGEDDWQELAESTELKADDQIRTKDSSRAVLTFSDDSLVRLNASTRVVIQSLANDKIALQNQAGQIYARVAQSDERQFVVSINDTPVTAKGTAFKVFNTIDTAGVEVYHNAVEVDDISVGEGEIYHTASPDAAKKSKILPIDIEQLKQDEFIMWCLAQDSEDDIYKTELGFLGDFTGPELTITAPKDGDIITVSDGATIGAVNVVGKTEKNAKVTIIVKSSSGEVPSDALVDASGGFGTGLLSGPIGKVTYEVVARDSNGNKTIKSVTIEYKTETKATPTPAASGVSPAVISDLVDYQGGKKVTWSVPAGTDVSHGFAIVWSKSSQPSATYPATDSVVAGPDARVGVIAAGKLEAEATYRVRLCIINANGGCDAYSNEIITTAPAVTPTPEPTP